MRLVSFRSWLINPLLLPDVVCTYGTWPHGDTVDHDIWTLFQEAQDSSQKHRMRMMMFLSALLQRDAEREREEGEIHFPTGSWKWKKLDLYTLLWLWMSDGRLDWDSCLSRIGYNDAFLKKIEAGSDMFRGRAAELLLGSGVWTALVFRIRGGKPGDFCRKCRQRSKS